MNEREKTQTMPKVLWFWCIAIFAMAWQTIIHRRTWHMIVADLEGETWPKRKRLIARRTATGAQLYWEIWGDNDEN